MWPDRVLNPGPLMPYRLAYAAWRKMLRDQLNSICDMWIFFFNLIAFRMAKTFGSFGCSECNRVKWHIVLAIPSAIGLNGIEFSPL